jgi:glutathione S-transferase
MILYFKPGACSLASPMILKEMKMDFDTEKVDTDKSLTASGKDYNLINSNGYVPALQLDSGEVLTEGVSILQYIADQAQENVLTPAVGTLQRARLQEYLNYTSSELHKAFSPLFSSTSNENEKLLAKDKVANKFDYLEQLFSDGRDYLLGESFSVADAYLFVVINWSNYTGIDLLKWPHLMSFVERVMIRESTQSAMRDEGLISDE